RQFIAMLDQLELDEKPVGVIAPILHVVRRRDKLQMLVNGQRIEQFWIIRHIGQLALGIDGLLDNIKACDRERAVRRRDNSGDGAKRGGLSGAVGSEQSENLSGADVKRQPGNRDRLAIALVEIVDLNHEVSPSG